MKQLLLRVLKGIRIRQSTKDVGQVCRAGRLPEHLPDIDNSTQAACNRIVEGLWVQRLLLIDDEGHLTKKANDDWSLGYVAGFSNALLQHQNIDVECHQPALKCVFSRIYVDHTSACVHTEFVLKQKAGNSVLDMGLLRGAKDYSAWQGRDIIPMSWVEYAALPATEKA